MKLNEDQAVVSTMVALIAMVYTVAPVANYYLYSFGFYFLNLSVIGFACVFVYLLVYTIIKPRMVVFLFSKKLFVILVSLLPFLIVTIISFFYSRNIDYAFTKLFSLVINITFMFWIASQFNEKAFSIYIKSTIITSLILGLLYPYFYSGLFEAAPDISSDNISVYLTSGSLLAFCGVLQVVFKPFKFLYGVWLAIIYVEIIFTGARGPLLFLLICHFLHNVVVMRKLSTLYFLTPVLIMVIFYIISIDSGDSLLSRAIWRFSLVFDGNSGARFEYWSLFYEHLTKLGLLLFGAGLGSYGVIAFGPGVRDYPHNLFIGIIADSGILGLLCFIVFIVTLIRLMVLHRMYKYSVVLLLPFLELQKSSTYAEFRIFWISIGVILFLAIGKGYFSRK
ncbi:O-antigen ligase family protein [Kangiella spongicola]|uniref:O-antigen ligase-related domain-containing protein n=1 Tax=Kangiella spongicola TaxID=796379 RepID=A0A318D2J0_9GAMM|nr:O-antigen ligase family protein [Kangiella spongicola]PXF63033.1 hypothetical protein DL796_06155 [Kangiella spongicola]